MGSHGHKIGNVVFFRQRSIKADEIKKQEADFLMAGGKMVLAIPKFEVISEP